MRPLGVEYLSTFGLPPVELIRLAARLECQHVSLGDWPFGENPHGYPAYSLRDDARLRGEVKAAMADLGVAISVAEGCVVFPDKDVGAYAPELDAFADLGAQRINALSNDPDMSRTIDQFARLAELAAARGLETVLELIPTKPVGSLAVAVDVVRQVGRPDFRLVIDTMHVARSGGAPAELAAVDPALISYGQLCDVPLRPRFESYRDEVYERMCPGAGELPLRDFLRALPRGLPIGLEIPMRAAAAAGVGPYERLKPCVDAARALLAEVD